LVLFFKKELLFLAGTPGSNPPRRIIY